MAKTQAEIVSIMKEKARCKEISTAAMERAYKAVWDTIKEELEAGESVTIQKFGTFSVVDTAARTGRNPHTGGTMEIPAGKRPKFKASTSFKDMVNK